ncbi:hypothetical protein, partial [Escherichia coli]|uniref:hypothetical protein n=1 Tax=Escherichia coli TaxID=562 RepID=UPI003FCFC6F0
MEGKNGLKIVCDSGAGFSTEQAVFLANNLAKKMRSLKQKCNLRQYSGNDSNLLIVFYVQIMPDDFVM